MQFLSSEDEKTQLIASVARICGPKYFQTFFCMCEVEKDVIRIYVR